MWAWALDRPARAGYDGRVGSWASLVAAALAWTALVWALVLVWLAIGALLRRWQLARRFAAQEFPRAADRTVLLVRPCAGLDVRLLENLVSVAEIRTRARLRVVMTVDDPDDLAKPIAEQAVAELRDRGIDASFELHPPTGPNRKASLLAGVMLGPRARGADFVINVDSNVDLGGFELDRLIGPLLADPELGATWAPWVEERTGTTVGARASEAVLGGTLTAFPLLCGIYPAGFVGKVWAMRGEAVSASGLRELVAYLGEDLEMSSRLRAAGWTTDVAPILARSRGGNPSFAGAVERFSRWMLVVRSQRLALMPTYLLFFFPTPIVLALAGVGALARPIVALVAASLAVLARTLITLGARYWSGRAGVLGALVDAPLSDAALGLAWFKAMRSRHVNWRGHPLRVDRSGRLVDPRGATTKS